MDSEELSILPPSPPLPPSSLLFTTNDGDIILRAGPEPHSKRDFRVHKFILSLASPVFKDMLAFPQPPNQAPDEQHQFPIVDVSDDPASLNMIFQFIYPGVEPPKITEITVLTSVLSVADKYNIASITPALRGILKTFIPRFSLRVYMVACRFGFSEEVKEAAEVTTAESFSRGNYGQDLQYISSTDIFRLVQFTQRRKDKGRNEIRSTFDLMLPAFVACGHDEDARGYYSYLEKAVEEAFVLNPRVESKDLFTVLDEIPDPPPGCGPPSRSAEWYYGDGDDDVFNCPLRPMTIRKKLMDIATELRYNNDVLLHEFFG